MSRAIQIDFLLAALRHPTTDQPLAGAKVHTYTAGTTSDKAVYTDAAKTTPAANPFTLDAAGRAQVYAEGSYKIVVKDSTDTTTLLSFDNLLFFVDDGSLPVNLGTTTGSSNTYVAASPNPNITSLTDGQLFLLIANHTNSGASTLNVGTPALGAVNIKYGTTPLDLVANDLVAGGMYILMYESAGGGRFRLLTKNFGTMATQDSSAISITGAVTYTTSTQVKANTSDTADNIGIALLGGGGSGSTRGAQVEVYGNEAGTPGAVVLQSGAPAGGTSAFDLTNASTSGTIDVNLNGQERWKFEPDGDLVGEINHGGNIAFNRDLRGVTHPVTAGLTATGTGISDGAAITRVFTDITGGSLTTVVVLPATIPIGLPFWILNSSGSEKAIFANTGHTINGAASVAMNALGDKVVVVGTSSTTWKVFMSKS